MKTFNYGQTTITANSFLEADEKALALGLETLVSDQTYERLKEFIHLSPKKWYQEEVIGDKTLVLILKYDDDEQDLVGAHIDICNPEDEHFMTDEMIEECVSMLKHLFDVKEIDLYDYHLSEIL